MMLKVPSSKLVIISFDTKAEINSCTFLLFLFIITVQKSKIVFDTKAFQVSGKIVAILLCLYINQKHVLDTKAWHEVIFSFFEFDNNWLIWLAFINNNNVFCQTCYGYDFVK